MSYNKPLPKINSDNRPFWDGCSKHELRFQQCRECSHVRWPASIICPRCHSSKTDWMVSRGTGKVYTFGVYHTAFHPGFADELPYTAAVVELDEGPRLLTNIVGCPPKEVKCLMPVEVVWEDIDNNLALPKFSPVL